MRPRIQRTRDDLRSTPYGDIPFGATHWHSNIGVGQLATGLREKIDAADLTEHELLEQIIIQVKMSNLHLMQISSENVTEEDIDGP